MTDPQGLYFQSVPDDGRISVVATANGALDYQWPNQLTLSAETLQSVRDRSAQYYFSVARHAPWPKPPWVINSATDADTYRNALIWLDETSGKTPVFNHPRAVALSRRDLSAARLQGVEGLTVPRCLRFRLDGAGAAPGAFERGGFDYPVLVRPHSGQAGRGLIRIDGPQDWTRLEQSRWFGQIHYMIEFVDFATEQVEHLKCRVMMVGGQVMVRHVKANVGWNVHNRAEGSIEGFEDRELAVIDQLEANPAFAHVCAQVAARARLDLVGMDLGIDPQRNRFVMFECNPSMTVFFPRRHNATSADLARRDRLQTPLDAAVRALLAQPDRWQSAIAGFHEDLPSCRDLLAGA